MGGEALKAEHIFGVAVGEGALKFDDVGSFSFLDNFADKVSIGGDRPIHILDSNLGVGAVGTAFGIEEIEVDDIAGF